MFDYNINKHPILTHANDIREICKPLLQFGIHDFCFSVVSNDNQLSSIGTNPKYCHHYLSNQYYNDDIYVNDKECLFRDEKQYIFWDMQVSSHDLDSLKHLSSDFGVHHVFTITNPKTVDNSIQYFHFSTNNENNNLNDFYKSNIEFLNTFGLYFKEKLLNHKELRLALSLKHTLSQRPIQPPQSEQVVKAIKTIKPKKIVIGPTRAVSITEKELECIKWLHLGKSANLTAQILGISPRTVEQRVNSVKNKLNCHSMYQLGEKVAEYELLSG